MAAVVRDVHVTYTSRRTRHVHVVAIRDLRAPAHAIHLPGCRRTTARSGATSRLPPPPRLRSRPRRARRPPRPHPTRRRPRSPPTGRRCPPPSRPTTTTTSPCSARSATSPCASATARERPATRTSCAYRRSSGPPTSRAGTTGSATSSRPAWRRASSFGATRPRGTGPSPPRCFGPSWGASKWRRPGSRDSISTTSSGGCSASPSWARSADGRSRRRRVASRSTCNRSLFARFAAARWTS